MNAQTSPELIATLHRRFERFMRRHEGMAWDDVRSRVESNPAAMNSLAAMEASGGEPDVIGYEEETGRYVFCDCSAESPAGRRSLCYDRKALDARKANRPQGSEVEAAAAMGVQLLTEDQYRALQRLGEFDLKTSSWIATPEDFRDLGGALFCDRQFGKVFVYHNGADAYFAARGFRARLCV